MFMRMFMFVFILLASTGVGVGVACMATTVSAKAERIAREIENGQPLALHQLESRFIWGHISGSMFGKILHVSVRIEDIHVHIFGE